MALKQAILTSHRKAPNIFAFGEKPQSLLRKITQNYIHESFEESQTFEENSKATARKKQE